MNADLILEKLTKLDEVKRFILFLEARFLSDEKSLSQLKIAKKSLDQALMNLVFDIEKKLENSQQNQSQKIKISDKIYSTFEHLKSFSDESLEQCLQDLTAFARSYENSSTLIVATRSEDLKNLRAKILLITSERFG